MYKKTITVGLIAVVAAVAAWVFAAADQSANTRINTKARVGTFDSRALTVAYVHSDLHDRYLKSLMAERNKAKKAGNTKRVKELEAQGEAAQQRVHRQTFGHARIDNILKHIKKEIPQIARKAGVDVVAEETLYHNSAVEIVDITDFVIEPFKPKEKTRKIIKDLRKRPPLSNEQLEKMHDH
ncbi:MAG: OmpH family outer membrane protein [Planctomycetota bacterium]|jgi:predicted peptidase